MIIMRYGQLYVALVAICMLTSCYTTKTIQRTFYKTCLVDVANGRGDTAQGVISVEKGDDGYPYYEYTDGISPLYFFFVSHPDRVLLSCINNSKDTARIEWGNSNFVDMHGVDYEVMHYTYYAFAEPTMDIDDTPTPILPTSRVTCMVVPVNAIENGKQRPLVILPTDKGNRYGLRLCMKINGIEYRYTFNFQLSEVWTEPQKIKVKTKWAMFSGAASYYYYSIGAGVILGTAYLLLNNER